MILEREKNKNIFNEYIKQSLTNVGKQEINKNINNKFTRESENINNDNNKNQIIYKRKDIRKIGQSQGNVYVEDDINNKVFKKAEEPKSGKSQNIYRKSFTRNMYKAEDGNAENLNGKKLIILINYNKYFFSQFVKMQNINSLTFDLK